MLLFKKIPIYSLLSSCNKCWQCPTLIPFWRILHLHSLNAHRKQAGRPRSNAFWGKPSTRIWQHWGINNPTPWPLSLHGLSTIAPRAASCLITPFTVFPPLPCLNTPLPCWCSGSTSKQITSLEALLGVWFWGPQTNALTYMKQTNKS